jgi:hypothetical protein
MRTNMNLIYNDFGRKRQYTIQSKREYRISGMQQSLSKHITVVSSLIQLEIGTVITLEQLNVNEFYPEYVKAYIPSMDVYIDAISIDEIQEKIQIYV